jgi:hypothetical protein
VVNYQAITALVEQIPADTWAVLREIKQRRPAIMLSELIDCSKRAPKQPEPSEARSPTAEPVWPSPPLTHRFDHPVAVTTAFSTVISRLLKRQWS